MNGPITSGGGPYLVVPEGAAGAWLGAADGAAYQTVCRGPDEGKVARLGGVDALVLGTPDPLYCAPLEDGSVFARVVSFDAADDAVLAEHLQQLPDDGWQELGTLVVDGGPWLAFDAALAGDDAGDDALRLDLPRGRYSVSATTYQPDGGTERLLTRLRR